MPGSVKFVLEAESAKAVSAFLKVVEAQKKTEKGLGDVSGKAKKTESDFVTLGDVGSEALNHIRQGAEELTHTLTSTIASFMSFEAVKKLLEEIVEGEEHALEVLKKFHEEARGGATLGAYIEDLPGFKQRSLDLSAKFGIDTGAISGFRERVMREVGTENDKDPERKQYEDAALEMHELNGSDPAMAFEAMRSLRETYQNLSVHDAQRFVEFANQKGGMGAAEQAQILPTILPTAADIGMPVDQLQALLATLARSGGHNQTMAKAFVNDMVKLPELMEPGENGEAAILQHGDNWPAIAEKLREYHDTDSAGFNKTFGRRGAGAMYAVIEHPDLFAQAMKDMTTFSEDPIGEESKKLFNDPGFKMAKELGQAEQVQANAESKAPPESLKTMLDFHKRVAVTETHNAENGYPWLNYTGLPQLGAFVSGVADIAPPEGNYEYSHPVSEFDAMVGQKEEPTSPADHIAAQAKANNLTWDAEAGEWTSAKRPTTMTYSPGPPMDSDAAKAGLDQKRQHIEADLAILQSAASTPRNGPGGSLLRNLQGENALHLGRQAFEKAEKGGSLTEQTATKLIEVLDRLAASVQKGAADHNSAVQGLVDATSNLSPTTRPSPAYPRDASRGKGGPVINRKLTSLK